MIKINFQEPNNDNWRAWCEQCEEEQKKHIIAIEANQPSEVKKDVYDGKKYDIKADVYMSLDGQFHGKCVYCESNIASDQDGDIEHFRPKNAVSDKDFKPIKIKRNGEEEDHPGYYWLCYDYKNLLLACTLCNKKRYYKNKQLNRRKLIGKHTRFPINGSYAVKPGEENNEEPLLLNPVFGDDDLEQHLELQKTGIFKSNSPKGKMCIEIFGLNFREPLVDGRRKAFKDANARFKLLWSAMCYNSEEANDLYEELMDVKRGETPYSAGGRLALKRDNLPDTSKIRELIDE